MVSIFSQFQINSHLIKLNKFLFQIRNINEGLKLVTQSWKENVLILAKLFTLLGFLAKFYTLNALSFVLHNQHQQLKQCWVLAY